MTKILVCGGRYFNDDDFLNAVLNKLHIVYSISMVVQGRATGADELAKMWPLSNDIQMKEYPADWKSYKKVAGIIRNRIMYDTEIPDIVIAFTGNNGTADMVKYAKKKNCKMILDFRDLENNNDVCEFLFGSIK